MVYKIQLRTENKEGGILIIHQLLGSFAEQLMDNNLLHRQSIVNRFERVNVT
jgi:hypothetical protein